MKFTKILKTFSVSAMVVGLSFSSLNTSSIAQDASKKSIIDSSVKTTEISFRALGNKDAPRVDEWFSLTCSHCAVFSKNVFPEIKKNLIDTGKLYYVLHDFPMDHLGLVAAGVANKLPNDTYFPLVSALLSTQENWAFGATKDNLYGKLKTTVALAGVSSEEFDKIVNDKDYLTIIANETKDAMDKYGINSTPSFKFPNGKIISGEMSYDTFIKNLNAK